MYTIYFAIFNVDFTYSQYSLVTAVYNMLFEITFFSHLGTTIHFCERKNCKVNFFSPLWLEVSFLHQKI